MGQPDCPADRVHEIKGHAVCIICHKDNPRFLSYQPVHIRVISFTGNSLSSVRTGYSADIGGVGLVGCRHIPYITA